jgi:uncharacterized membrane protein
LNGFSPEWDILCNLIIPYVEIDVVTVITLVTIKWLFTRMGHFMYFHTIRPHTTVITFVALKRLFTGWNILCLFILLDAIYYTRVITLCNFDSLVNMSLSVFFHITRLNTRVITLVTFKWLFTRMSHFVFFYITRSYT